MQQVRSEQQTDHAETGVATNGTSPEGIKTALYPVSDPVTAKADSKRRNATMNDTQKSTKRTTGKTSKGFTAEERAAIREAVREQKAATGETEVLAKIAEMPDSDRVMAERLHAIIKASAPDLVPRTWYGMPAYAKDGNVLCFFRSAEKFKTRYATLGFSDKASLDDGAMWPTDFALKELTADNEARIAALVKKAVS